MRVTAPALRSVPMTPIPATVKRAEDSAPLVPRVKNPEYLKELRERFCYGVLRSVLRLCFGAVYVLTVLFVVFGFLGRLLLPGAAPRADAIKDLLLSCQSHAWSSCLRWPRTKPPFSSSTLPTC